MNGRWALGGVALTMLCSAATAQTAFEGASDGLEPSPVARTRALPRRKVSAPVPPGRPIDLATEIPLAPWDVHASLPAPAFVQVPAPAFVTAPTSGIAQATLPVLPTAPAALPALAAVPVPAALSGPAVGPAPVAVAVVSEAEAEAIAARSVAVSVVPPLRPAFGEARTEVATVEIAVPLPPEAPDRTAIEALAAPVATIRLAVLPPRRPALAVDLDPIETASLPDATVPAPQPVPAQPQILSLFAPFPQPAAPAEQTPLFGGSGSLRDRIAYHARLNDVPEALVHRVIIRESRYNPRAVGRGGALGLMQIKHATARALGYGGPAMGLLEAETNLTYAVKYLAGAYRVAGGDFDGAVRNYARGYYYAAKRQGLVRTADLGRRLKRLREANAKDLAEETITPATFQR